MTSPSRLDMEDQSAHSVQTPTGGSLAEHSTSSTSIQTARDVTTHGGDAVFAGGNVNIHHYNVAEPKVYYYTIIEPRLNIVSAFRLVRNQRKLHLGVLSKATRGTGIWLLKTDKFILWLDLNGNLKILWGTGIPGAGKTVIASTVINELENRAATARGSICVCYVYFRYSDARTLTIRDVLEILVKQTVERHPECAPVAEEVYARHAQENTQPTEGELLRLLKHFTKAKPATFYTLDALDEAPDRLQVEIVLKLAKLNVRLFITSRPLKAVEARVPNAHCFPIIARDGDLDLHIAREISRSRDLSDLLEKVGSSLRDEIVSVVKSKCDGMFLHASLQLEALCECLTTQEVKQTLRDFPPKIEDVYRQTWHRILEQKPNRVSLAKAVLVWTLNASRSMTIDELERAVATSRDNYKFEPDRLAPGTALVTLCGGLVTVEEESRLVRLVHYTAKATLEELLHDSFPYPDSQLAMVCMTHLAECGFQNTTLRSEEEFTASRQADPLLAYASDSWAFHALKSINIQDTRRRTEDFVRGCKAFPAYTHTIANSVKLFDILSPLHMVARYNLRTPSWNIDISDPNVATSIRQASPLMLASLHGHEDMARLLLARHDTQVNLVNIDGRSALMLAAYHGHDGIISALLERPETQVNLVNKNGWSALMAAAENGQENTVRLLLSHSEIQVDLVDNAKRSAWRMAYCGGHEAVARLLPADLGTIHTHTPAPSPANPATRSAEDGPSSANDEGEREEGVDDDRAQSEPSGSTSAKRPRDDEEDGLQGPVDDMATPASKRHHAGANAKGLFDMPKRQN